MNAGGVLNAIGIESLQWPRATVDARVAGIGDALGEVYTHAEAQ